MRRSALALLALTALACQAPEREEAVWFVHATDPHLFYGDVEDETLRPHQEKLNQKAFGELIRSLDPLPGTAARPEFLVVTGDFGLDSFPAGGPSPANQATPPAPPGQATGQPPAEPAAPPSQTPRERAVDLFVQTLKTSPVKDIYLVPGNNDVVDEAAQGSAIAAMDAFLADVQKGLAGSGVMLHDLTSCYRGQAAASAGCSVDLPGTSFRLIGFPSHSFKNASQAAYDANRATQESAIETLAALVRQAEAQGKKVLIVTHIAEVDDPYTLARKELAGSTPSRTGWAAASPWNVSPAVFQKWKEIVDSGTVAGVLAGHFHDSHKEIYAPPYGWSTTPTERASLRKLFLAPPLSTRFQDTSPIQARGFALFRAAGDDLERRLFWYDAARSTFTGEPEAGRPEPPQVGIASTVSWLWRLGSTGTAMSQKEQLARATLVAIAFIAALLTVIALWEIPPATPTTVSQTPPTEKKPATPAAAETPAPARTATALAAPFKGNFATTVLSGLGGMAAVSFIDDSFWKESGISAKAQYLVYFVAFFVTILAASALYQGVVESLRSRVVLEQRPPSWPPRNSNRWFSWVNQRLIYWSRRLWRWLLSLRSVLLIFLDTLFNVIQGKNQTKTAIFGQDIINLHWSIYWTVEQIRKSIDDTLRRILKPVHDSDIRVNISILSDDNSSVTYLAWERGSLGKPFNQRSVGWVSVYTGEARWVKVGKDWNETYSGDREVVLYKNESSIIPSESGPLHLFDHYQARETPDYEAFIILPVPWSRRSETRQYRRAGIHISFRNAKDIDTLWKRLEIEENVGGKEKLRPNYAAWKDLLECEQEIEGSSQGSLLANLVGTVERLITSEMSPEPMNQQQSETEKRLRLKNRELQAVLQQSMDVLGEVLRHFNTTLFEEKIRPQIKV